MTILIVAIVSLLAAQQGLPRELQVSQLEDPRAKNANIVVIPGQTPVITNTQLPGVQLEQQTQPQLVGRPFDVHFRGSPFQASLNALAQQHGLNLVMPPSIDEPPLTIDLINVTLAQALDAILSPRGMVYAIDGNLLRIDRLQPETRTFKFDYVTTERSMSRSMNASSSAGGSFIGGFAGGTIGGAAAGVTGGGFTGGTGGSSTSLSGQENVRLLNDIQIGIDSLKSGPNARVIFNRIAGIIMVTDFPQNLEAIGLFLETVQNAVNRQVVIETRVIEVKLNDESQVGVNWTAVLGNSVRIDQTLGVTPTFQFAVTVGDFNAVITALETQGAVNVRSAPSIATLNNQPAVIRVGTQDVFFTTTTQVDPRTGIIIQTAIVPSAINEGVVLDVTPQISDDGIIIMNVHPTVTERTGQAVSPRGDTVPIVDVRESDNVVRVADGQTVVIAGLISQREFETVNKVPLLGDIPLVGGLFRRTIKENRKTDLAILITPRILDIRTAVDYTRDRIQQQERLKAEKKR